MSSTERARGALVALVVLFASLSACGTPPTPTSEVRILALGDSLTAGFGLQRSQAWPALLQSALEAKGWRVEVINGGVSGDTIGDGLERLPALLRPPPDLVLVALGGNDGLQRRPIEQTQADLEAIVRTAQAVGADVALIGVRLPVFVQGGWSDPLGQVYVRVADGFDLPLLPDMLDGVVGDPRLMLGDGVHPNAAGQARLAESITAFVVASHSLP